MRLELNVRKCQGYANCIVEAPELFDLDEVTSKATLLVEEPTAEQLESARRAELSCPASAISLHE